MTLFVGCQMQYSIFVARSPWRNKGLIVDVTDNELEYASEHFTEKPGHWREALQLTV